MDGYLNEAVAEYGAILDLELQKTSDGYNDKFEQLLKDDKKEELLKQVVESSKLLIPKFGDKPFEPTVNLYLHTLDVLTSDGDSDIIDALTKTVENIDAIHYDSEKSRVKPTSIISALSNIFNFLPEFASLRLEILQNIVSVATNNYLQSLLSPIVENIVSWITPIQDADPSAIRTLVNDIFDEIYARHQQQALEFYKSLIQSEQVSSALDSADYEKFTLKALSANKYFKISDLELSTKLNDPALTQLLKIVDTANLAQFNTFVAGSESKSLGDKIDLKQLSKRVQALTFATTLGDIEESTGNTAFPYEQISDEVKVPEDEVEEFVVYCIQQGLVSGRLSQSDKKFYLTRISREQLSNRPLNGADWVRAGENLDKWANSIRNLQSFIKNLSLKNRKRMLPPQVIQIYHQQKQELKEKREREQEQHREEELKKRKEEIAEAPAPEDEVAA